MTEPVNIEANMDHEHRRARKIEAYWQSRGATVICITRYVPGKHSRDESRRFVGWWEVRSDMINGLPRVRA